MVYGNEFQQKIKYCDFWPMEYNTMINPFDYFLVSELKIK